MTRQYLDRVRCGPRDVFALDQIRIPVVDALVHTGMPIDLIVDLLGIIDPEVVTLIQQENTAVGDKTDVRRALLEWAQRRAFRVENMCQAYAGACEYSLAEVIQLREKRPEIAEARMAFRVNHEILQALKMWLAIDQFTAVSYTRSSMLAGFLRPACADDEGERNLAYMVQLAFQTELGLPLDRVENLWREAVVLACSRKFHAPTTTPGMYLSAHLSCTEWEIVQRDFRPFFAPMWPVGAGERVREALRSREWVDDEAAEVFWFCNAPALYRAASEAAEVYVQAKGRGDTETMDRVRADVDKKQKASMRMSRNLDNKHEKRHATHIRIATWLAEHHPELIELVRPCGNPLGAQWPNLTP